MKEQKFDVVVLGTGPGGEGAAMRACKGGKSVAVVERHHQVGGGCTHWGTIPSKALRHAINRLLEFNSNPLYRTLGNQVRFSYPELLRTAESVIDKQVTMRSNFYTRNGINVIRGTARFIDPHTIEVLDAQERPQVRVKAEHFVIATGSRPYRPDDIDFTHPHVYDSDTILSMATTPNSITIYGAGVIGCEYASMFRNMGCKVDLVDTRTQLLAFLDDEISHALSYHLRDQGLRIRHGEEYCGAEGHADGVVLHMKSGKRIKNDVLLWANGRTGNSEIGLEGIGIKPNKRGQIEVDQNYRTALPHIYAVGDIIGYPSLASAAYDQGRFAATHLVEGYCDSRLVDYVPTGIYTSPEISSVGRTERELTEARIPYEVGHAWFKSLARAQITGKTVGMLKILFHRETLEVLGIHCFGDQAAEIIHIGQAILSQKGEANSLNYFINTTFNYPTMAEAYRVAALNGLNRLR